MATLVAKQAIIARERMLELDYYFKKLAICSRAYHEAAEIQMNRNRTIIRAATLENKQLRSALNALLEAERCSFGKSDMPRLVKRVKDLRRCYDDQKNLILLKQVELDKACTNAKSAKLDLAGMASDRIPIQRLEAIVNHIKNKIKVGKILSKSYEDTVRPMRLERGAFETQMATYEGSLKIKEVQLAKLILLYNDAEKARTAAKMELDEMLQGYCAGGPDEKKTPDSKEETMEIDGEIGKIKPAFNVTYMREMFLDLIEQQKKTQYYQKIFQDLVELELRKGLSLEQKLRMRRGIPGVHVLQEVLGESEEAKNNAIYVGTLMTTIQGTKDVINQLDRKQKLKMTRHSGNLISMLTGTKRLVDKIHEGELYCSEDKSVEKLLQKCKMALVLLLRDVNKKVKVAKFEKEKKEKAGTSTRDESTTKVSQSDAAIEEEDWVAIKHATP